MAAEGSSPFQSMLDKSKEFNSQYVLIVEGSIPLKADGKYCVVGEVDHHEYTVAETTDILARSAAASLPPGHVRRMAAFQRRAGSRRKR